MSIKTLPEHRGKGNNLIINEMPTTTLLRPEDAKVHLIAQNADICQKREQLAHSRLKVLKRVNAEGVKTEIGDFKEWMSSLLDAEKSTEGNSTQLTTNFQLAVKVMEIIHLIEDDNIPPNAYHAHMSKVREALHEALSLSSYEELQKEEIPMIKFLQHAGSLLHSSCEGMSVIEDVGKAAIEGIDENETVKASELSTIIRKEVGSSPGYRKNNIRQLLEWVIWHLYKAIMGFLDEKVPGGYHFYHPFKLDNDYIYCGNYLIGDKQVKFNVGPSVASDSVFEKAHLAYLKSKGSLHMQHSLEFPHGYGERGRLEIQKQMAKGNDNFYFWSSPLDGDAWKGEGTFAEITSVEAFHTELNAQITAAIANPKVENGFQLPKTQQLLDSQDVKQALEYSQQALKVLIPDFNPQNDEQENRRLSKAMLLCATGFMTIRAMQNFGKRLREIKATGDALPTMGEACKQGIDRGVIMNATVRTFVEMIAKGELNGKDAAQIVGLIKFRALQVDDRLILEDRLEAFLTLLELIGKNEAGFITVLKEFASLKKDMPLRFESSKALEPESVNSVFRAPIQ